MPTQITEISIDEVTIQRAENGWIITHRNQKLGTIPRTEICTNLPALLKRVAELLQ